MMFTANNQNILISSYYEYQHQLVLPRTEMYEISTEIKFRSIFTETSMNGTSSTHQTFKDISQMRVNAFSC